MEKNYIAADTLTAIRDSLSGDSQLRHFELRRKAVDLRMHGSVISCAVWKRARAVSWAYRCQRAPVKQR